MKKIEEINSKYLTGALIALPVVGVLLVMSPYTDMINVITYILFIVGALFIADKLSKKKYVLSNAKDLDKRVLMYAALSLFIGILSVVFSGISNVNGFSLDFTLYIVYRSLFYALILFIYYYIHNEKKLRS